MRETPFVAHRMGMTAFPPHLVSGDQDLNDHVPGFAVNGWLVRYPIERWGHRWVEHGSMEVRYRKPLHVGDELVIAFTDNGTDRFEFSVTDHSGAIVASGWAEASDPDRLVASIPATPNPEPPLLPYADALLGQMLGTITTTFDAERDLAWTHQLAVDDPWRTRTDAHPAVLVWSANVLVRDAIDFTPGRWKHAGSVTKLHSEIPNGSELRYCGQVARTFRAGSHEFFVAQILVEANGEPAASLELTYLCEQPPEEVTTHA